MCRLTLGFLLPQPRHAMGVGAEPLFFPIPLQKGKTGDGIGFPAFVAIAKQGQVVLRFVLFYFSFAKGLVLPG